MSVAAISSAPNVASASPATATAAQARAVDGDSKTANAKSAHIKDSDGDYRPLTRSAAAQSSPAVQASQTSLKVGG